MRARKEWLEWFRVDRDLLDHPKLHDLAKRGGWTTDKAIGRLIRLWCWVARHAADGMIPESRVHGLSVHMFDMEQHYNHHTDIASGYDGRCPCCEEPDVTEDAKAFGMSLAPFVDAGFIVPCQDGLEVHDWSEMNGYSLRERERDRERKSAKDINSDGTPAGIPRERRGNGGGIPTDSHRNGTDTEQKKSQKTAAPPVKQPLVEKQSTHTPTGPDVAMIAERLRSLGPDKTREAIQIAHGWWKANIRYPALVDGLVDLYLDRHGLIENPFAYFNPKGQGFQDLRERMMGRIREREGQAMKATSDAGREIVRAAMEEAERSEEGECP